MSMSASTGDMSDTLVNTIAHTGDFFVKHWKKFFYSALIAATISGTYSGNEDGFTPFHNKKTGKVYGINIGGQTDYAPGSELYGVDISFYRANQGTINGIELSIWSRNYSKINGLEMSLFNVAGGMDVKNNGVQIGLANIRDHTVDSRATSVNGLQIGVASEARRESGITGQVGIYNYLKEGDKSNTSFLLNYRF